MLAIARFDASRFTIAARPRPLPSLFWLLTNTTTASLDMLPPLTRAAFLLAAPRPAHLCRDSLALRPRCREVQLRVADGLAGISWALDGRATPAMHLRAALWPWRDAWARHRLRRRHWRLGRCYRAAQARLAPQDPWHRRFLRKIKGLAR